MRTCRNCVDYKFDTIRNYKPMQLSDIPGYKVTRDIFRFSVFQWNCTNYDTVIDIATGVITDHCVTC